TDRPHGLEEDRLREMELMGQELVRMLRFDSPSIKRLGGEVLEIDRDNEIGTTLYCRGEDKAVIRVRQLEHIDELLEIGHDRVAHVRIHQIARSLELRARQIPSILENGPDPLLMHCVGPLGAVEVRNCKLHEEVAERCGIENRCVE